MKPLVLASKSPRRKEILIKAGLDFIIKDSDYEEELDNKIFSYEKIENLARNKALGAMPHIEKPSLILGADTVVVLDNTILTKPIDKQDAFNILKKLSNKEHKVVTSICVLDSATQKYIINSTTTKVEFDLLTDEMINNYIEEYKPFDKAGAYGIQELPQGFVKSLKGDTENVIGLSSKSAIDTISKLELLLRQRPEKSFYPQD